MMMLFRLLRYYAESAFGAMLTPLRLFRHDAHITLTLPRVDILLFSPCRCAMLMLRQYGDAIAAILC